MHSAAMIETTTSDNDRIVDAVDDITAIAAGLLVLGMMDDDGNDNAFPQPDSKSKPSSARWNPTLAPWLSWLIVICLWLVLIAMIGLI